MAETIKGINVVIGAETSGLSKALTDVTKKSKDIQSELKQVDKLLKLDPTNTELVSQKQKLLADAVTNTQDKLNRLKAVQEQVNQQFSKGDITEGQYRAFQREVAATETELTQLNAKLSEVSGEVKKQSTAVEKLGADYKESFDQAKESMGNSFEQMKKVGAGITALGAAGAYALGGVVGAAREFEQSMSNVKAVMSPDEVKEYSGALEDLAQKLGADTKYSATEAAQGIEELVKAGVKTTDILNGGLAGALSLAAAGDLELADAAEIASTALNAFKDDALSVQQAADLLAGAANASATDVMELKFGLSQVAAVASGMGLSFKDTTTALAVFAQNGLKGSDAGTSLKTMLMNLQPHTADAYAEFNRLGLMVLNTEKAMEFLAKEGIKPAEESTDGIIQALAEYLAKMDGAKTVTNKYFKQAKEMADANGLIQSAFYDASGSMKSMEEIAGLLQDSMKGLNDAQRAEALQTLFGSDAIRAGNVLFKEGAKGVRDMAAAMSQVGADQVAAQKMNNLNGVIEQLNGSIETAKISLGQALLPAIRAITEAVQWAVDGFNAMPEGMKNVIAIGGAVATALALIVGPLTMLIGFLPSIIAGFTALAPVFAALTGPIGLIIAAIAGLVAGIVILYEKNEWFRESVQKTWKAIVDFIKPIIKEIVSFASEQLDKLKQFWQDNEEDILTIVEYLKVGIKLAWDNIVGNLKLALGIIQGLFEIVWPFISNTIRVTWEAIKLVISTALDVIKGNIQFWIKIFTGDWKGAWDTVLQMVKNIWGNVETFLKNINLKQIGKDIMQGLLDGISSMGDAITDRVKGIADSIGDGLKSALGIHSPSRVTMELGEYTGEGFAIGLENSLNQIKNQTEAMAAAALPNVTQASMPSSSSTTNHYSFEGMLSGANFTVRTDADIDRIAEALYRKQQTAMRGAGAR